MSGYQLITCIVEKGEGEKVVNEALNNGAQAATYFHAYGKGIREKLGIFGKLIQPEKEVIFVITTSEQTQSIFDGVAETAELKEAGKGIAFVIPVGHVAGFLNVEKKDTQDYNSEVPEMPKE